MRKYGMYKNSYNIASRSFELLQEVSQKLFPMINIAHIKSLGMYLDVYRFECNSEYEIDNLFKKFNIYPLTVDEVLGFLKRDLIEDTENPQTAEQILGEEGTLPNLYQQKYAKMAWERYHMDSTSRFIVGDSFSELLKAIVIVGYSTIGNELTEEQKVSVERSLGRLVDIYGDVDYCISKLDEYSLGLLNMMSNYKLIKTQVLEATTSEDIWL